MRRLSILCTLVLGLLLSGCYATRMALHHNDLFNTRRPVDEVLDDPATPEKVREQLLLVKRVMAFAEAAGLNTKGAYHYYIHTNEPVVSYIVQAAYADRLESVTWWFPFVGSVPYRGYFDKTERDAKADELRDEGYDVDTGGAGAFSSLGWFDDPIFSSMLQRSEADLAHLFFHELTHRTFWARGSARFNENLAEYVGLVLTRRYLEAKGDRAALSRYEEKRKDRKLFYTWLVALRADLETLYENKKGLSQDALLKAKAALFARYLKPPKKPNFKAVDFVGTEAWNNASVLGASLYTPDTDAFEKAHACLKDAKISVFLDTLREAADATGDPFVALESLCRA